MKRTFKHRTPPESTCHSTRGASDTALAFLDNFRLANHPRNDFVADTRPLPEPIDNERRSRLPKLSLLIASHSELPKEKRKLVAQLLDLLAHREKHRSVPGGRFVSQQNWILG